MNKTIRLIGVFTIAALIAFSFASCGGGGGGETYTLMWGTTDTSYTEVEDVIDAQGWRSQTTIVNSKAAYTTGTTATAVYNYCTSGAVTWYDGDTIVGSFEKLVNSSKDGVSAPQALKAALISNKANVPLAGIFDTGMEAALFYITKN